MLKRNILSRGSSLRKGRQHGKTWHVWLQIATCGCMWGCGRRGGWQGGLGQSRVLPLPLPRTQWLPALLIPGPEVNSVSCLTCLAWKFSFAIDVNWESLRGSNHVFKYLGIRSVLFVVTWGLLK